MEAGQSLTASTPTRYGTANNLLGWAPPPQTGTSFVPLPRGMDISLFRAHMDSWYNGRLAADTVCPVSAPSQDDKPPTRMDPRLFRAAKEGDVEGLEKLLESKLDVFSQMTPADETALHIAASEGEEKFVEELIKLVGEGFVKLKNRQGDTALHVACASGNAEIVKAVVDKCVDLVHQTNNAGETALFKAVEEGHAEIVEKLLEYALPSHNMKRSSDGQTPLHRAVFLEEEDVVDKLIAHRPELLREKDNEGWTPLHIAVFTSIPKSPPALWFYRSRKRYNNVRQIFKKLISEDRSVCYMVDNDKLKPLHLAVLSGNPGLVQEILDQCEDCSDMVDSLGRNPLHLAVENASYIFQRIRQDIRDIIIPSFLREKHINCIDNFGRTPLDVAAENESTDPQLYIGIRSLLRNNGGLARQRRLRGNPWDSSSAVKTPWNSQIIAVNAVLLATVAFAVAFTLPGNHDSADINSLVFQVLVIFDAFAFCFSIASALLLVYAHFYSKNEDELLTRNSMGFLRVGMVSTAITFGAAIHIVVAQHCLWLAVLVWVMVCYLPIWISQLSYRAKPFLFSSRKGTVHFYISETRSTLKSFSQPLLKLARAPVDTPRYIYFFLLLKIRRRHGLNSIP